MGGQAAPESGSPFRDRWVEMILVLGHLALIAGLAVSALSDRPERRRVISAGPSILESLKAGVEDAPRR